MQTANEDTNKAILISAIGTVVVLIIIIIGLIIGFSFFKGLHHKRTCFDIETVGYKSDDNQSEAAVGHNATIDEEKNIMNQSEHQLEDHTEITQAVTNEGSEVNKVANPENEENDTTDLITSTQVQRIKPYGKMQRGYEMEIGHREHEEETMRNNIKTDSIILGEVNDNPVMHCQETNENSSACFCTMVRKSLYCLSKILANYDYVINHLI